MNCWAFFKMSLPLKAEKSGFLEGLSKRDSMIQCFLSIICNIINLQMNFQTVKQTNYHPFTTPLRGHKMVNTSLQKSAYQPAVVQLNQNLVRSSSINQFSRSSIKPDDQRQLINDVLYEQVSVSMPFVFESLYSRQMPSTEPESLVSIKMMDTILFGADFKPKKWIFTDIKGRIQFKTIDSITVNDVIRAFLVNLNEHKKNEFNNEDLLEFLSKNTNRSKICFAIYQSKRHFLNIEQLSDIKNRFSKGLEALQLYKIPTREFLPFFYYHTVNLNTSVFALPQVKSHYMTRLSHYAMDIDKQNNFFEERVPDAEYFAVNLLILELSKQIVLKIQAKHPNIIVKSIKLTYLIEQANYDPWFIGTEYCTILRKCKATQPNKQNSKSQPRLQVKHKYQRDNSQDHQSNIGYLNVPTATDINDNEDYMDKPEQIYDVGNANYVSKSELLQGLSMVGHQYGKQIRPNTQEMRSLQKSRRSLKTQQQNTSQTSQNRRIMELLPKFIEKSQSKKHTNFLFGQTSSERVFQDYQRLRTQTSNVKQRSQNRDHSNDQSKSIFEIHLSDAMAYTEGISQRDQTQYEKSFYGEPSEIRREGEVEEVYVKNDVSMFKQANHSAINEANYSHLLKQQKSNKDFLKQSLIESYNADDSVLIKLGRDQQEKEGIQLMLINKDLNGIVMLDRDKVQKSYLQRQNIISQDSEYNRNQLKSQGSSTRLMGRKLTKDESRSYIQWKQSNNQLLNQNSEEQIINLEGISERKRMMFIRSKTPVFTKRKSGSNRFDSKKLSALQKLQILGNQATLKSNSGQSKEQSGSQSKLITLQKKNDNSISYKDTETHAAAFDSQYNQEDEKCQLSVFCKEPIPIKSEQSPIEQMHIYPRVRTVEEQKQSKIQIRKSK
ncbi:hypothetical protein FGO68_gene17731 [Halteria grandinella]|uniref:Uncharacterized protein n=1 Tax=Halteria grandinella TaxID=5974 RepID=A0A8J8P5F3_HALGN|nr:hypothetical protein FGO68_gene17731 [Halteria grandinella]